MRRQLILTPAWGQQTHKVGHDPRCNIMVANIVNWHPLASNKAMSVINAAVVTGVRLHIPFREMRRKCVGI